MEEKKYRIYVCAGLHCTPAGRERLLRALEDALWEYGLDADVELRASSCLNRCDFAPNVTVWPGPVRYSRLTPGDMRRIVAQHLRDGQVVEELLFKD
jgi:(2Fe-2S) ferredoxin